MTRSSSAGLSSMLKLYLNPEQPPGSTAMRSPAVSGETFSSAMNFLTSTAAGSVTVRVMGLVCCVVAIAILQSRANLDSSFGQVNSLPRGCRHYAPNARRLGGRRPLLPVQRRRRSVLQEPGQPEHYRVLSLREKRALVAGGHVDGGDHVRRGHAARRHRPGGAPRRRGELAVVEPAHERDADRVFLRTPVAPRRRNDRYRILGNPLRGSPGRIPAGLPGHL